MQAFEGVGRSAKTVVKTIIALGRELHMRVTVEDVETAKQVAILDNADGGRCKELSSAGRCPPQSALIFSQIIDGLQLSQSRPGRVAGHQITRRKALGTRTCSAFS